VTATDALIAPRGGDRRLPLMLGIAARELRGGLSGFRIFIACVALGVMVITGVGAVSDALRAGFERQGEAILGGDATLARTHVRAAGDERAVIDAFGRVSETATMRTMARRPDGSDQALGELKGVDAAYPLVGTVEVEVGSDEVPSVLRGLVISQAERGRGYGRAALELVETFLADEHAAGSIAADVPAGYDDGERFLEAVGYRERRLKLGDIRWIKRLRQD